MTDVNSDEVFQTLPPSVRRRIDNAFEYASKVSQGSIKRRRLMEDEDDPMNGGGFIPEGGGGSIPDDTAGGFLPDDGPMQGGFIPEETNTTNDPESVPFSSIPSLLSRLGLDPHDDEVLQVFRNAATGWSNGDMNETDARVSRDDWRAVCAVLLESHSEVEESDDVGDQGSGGGDASDDVYVDSDPGESSQEELDDDDDDYGGKPRKPTKKSTRKARALDTSSGTDFELSDAQKRVCVRDFERFFTAFEEAEAAKPSKAKAGPVASGSERKIQIKHIQQVASLLGERLKAEEIVEMLSIFSTAPDKASVSLADFERIMVETGLVQVPKA